MPQKLSAELFATVVRSAPLISIDLLVRDASGCLLVGLRTNRPAQGSLFVPGGVIRKGERLAEAFERITAGELGEPIPIARSQFVGVFEHFYHDNAQGDPAYGTHYIVLAHSLTVDRAALALPREQHSAYVWASDRQLLANDRVHQNTKAYCQRR